MNAIFKKSLLVAGAVAMLGVATSAMAGTDVAWSYNVQQENQINWNGYSPCMPDDLINLKGIEKWKMNAESDTSNNFKIRIQSTHVGLKGASAAGIEYNAPGGYIADYQGQGDSDVISFKLQSKCPLISRGKAPNFMYHIWRTVSISKSTNKVTIETFKENSGCTGAGVKDSDMPEYEVTNN